MSIKSRERQRQKAEDIRQYLPQSVADGKPGRWTRNWIVTGGGGGRYRPKSGWHKSHMYRATTVPNDPARARTRPHRLSAEDKRRGPGVRISDILPHLA